MHQSRLIFSLCLLMNWLPILAHAGDSIDLTKKFDVIIIGAGTAGLAAARELRADGQQVLILEASDRIGGRVFSVNPWGATVELGASWIHGVNDNPIGDLAKALNLTLVSTRYNHKSLNCQFYDLDLRESSGDKIDDRTMFELKKLVSRFMWYVNILGKDPANQHLSMLDALHTFVEKNPVPEELKRPFVHMARTMIIFEDAAELDQISVIETGTYSDHGASGDDVILINGYKQIIAHLAQNLHILLNEKVTTVNYQSDGVTVGTSAGKQFSADYVISTVPLGVLQKGVIAFNPPLPKEKIEAINELEMGVMNKIYLFFPCSFWETSDEWLSYIPEDPHEGILYFLNLKTQMHQPILLAFIVGSFAKEFEDKTDQESVDYVMNVLGKMYGDKTVQPTSSIITRWGKNPFSYGSFSLMSLRTNPNAYELMSKPVGNRLFFAGEAATTTEQGTVYAAYMSGIETAKQVMESSHQIKLDKY